MIRKLASISLAAGALFLGACHEDGTLEPPTTPTGGALMSRYVAMGNSITAGFQSAGINDSTQKQSYAALVAAAMGSPFYYPSLTNPGCPPPFDSVFTASGVPHRLGGATETTCFFRSAALPPYLSNVAVPGAKALDLL